MPAIDLNLPAYTVLAAEETASDYVSRVEVSQAPSFCPNCGSDHLVGFGHREQPVKDLPFRGKRVVIYVSTRRMLCRTCGRTFSEQLPDVDKKRAMTARLVGWIGPQAVKRTFSSIAEEVGVVPGTVRAIFLDYVRELGERIRFATPRWMGIEEMHVIHPRNMVTNVESCTTVDLLLDRSKGSLSQFLRSLADPDAVEYVAMDLWLPSRNAVRAVLPAARIVVDGRHVVRLADEAVDSVWSATAQGFEGPRRRNMTQIRGLLTRREGDLSEQERLLLADFARSSPVIGEAFWLKERFWDIYDAETPAAACSAYEEWSQAIPRGLRAHFKPIIKAFEQWMPEILAYFEHPVANDYGNAVNELRGVVNQLGRGYSFEALRVQMLYSENALNSLVNGFAVERRTRAPREAVPLAGVDLTLLARLIGTGEI